MGTLKQEPTKEQLLEVYKSYEKLISLSFMYTLKLTWNSDVFTLSAEKRNGGASMLGVGTTLCETLKDLK